MAYKKTFNYLKLTLLLLSVILQIVSLSAPGWYISANNEESIAYVGVFYMKKCLNTTCEIWSKHEGFHAKLINYSKFEYNKVIAEQVYMVLTFYCTAVTLVLQFCKCRHGDARVPRSTGMTTSVCLGFASGLMIVILTSNYIETQFLLEMSNQINYKGFHIFFPYCILLYTLAFITNVAASVLFMVDVFQQEDWKP